MKIKNCPFEIEIGQCCESSRDFNELDTMFFFSDPYYVTLCQLAGLSNVVSPSQLMKELEKIRGNLIKFQYEKATFQGTLDFSDAWQIMLKNCKEIKPKEKNNDT